MRRGFQRKSDGVLDAPADIVVKGMYTGTNVVKWKAAIRVGDERTYAVERRIGGGDWERIATVDGRKFNDMDQKPGVETAYRVVTLFDGTESAPSTEVSVYVTRDWQRRADKPAAFAFTLDVATGA